MNHDVARIRQLFVKARSDPEYAGLTESYKKAQTAFESLVGGMTDAEQDIIWGFVCISDQMNWRMMELMCDWYDKEKKFGY